MMTEKKYTEERLAELRKKYPDPCTVPFDFDNTMKTYLDSHRKLARQAAEPLPVAVTSVEDMAVLKDRRAACLVRAAVYEGMYVATALMAALPVENRKTHDEFVMIMDQLYGSA